MEIARPTALYLDDMHLGQKFQSESYVVTADEIKSYARQYDPQPFHLDENDAKDTFFAGLAASGWHVASITMRLLVSGAAPIADGIIGAGGVIAWPTPTRPGDVLRVNTEIVEIRPSKSRPNRGMISMKCETRNQNGDVVQAFTATLVVPKRPSPA